MAERTLGKFNPVVTSEQPITEPGRSGKPNPVVTSEQPITEPAHVSEEEVASEHGEEDRTGNELLPEEESQQ